MALLGLSSHKKFLRHALNIASRGGIGVTKSVKNVCVKKFVIMEIKEYFCGDF